MYLVQKALLLGRKVDMRYKLHKIGRARELQLGAVHPLRHFRKIHRHPVLIEVFMRQIAAVLFFQGLEPAIHCRHGACKFRVGFEHTICKTQRLVRTGQNTFAR